MQIKWQVGTALLIAAFLLGLLLAGKTSMNATEHTVHEREIFRTRIDTAHSIVNVSLAPIMAIGRTNRILTHTIHDTLYQTACLDSILVTDTTAIAPDTLSVCYERRLDNFAVRLWLSPRRKEVMVPYLAHDTFYWREDSVRITGSTPHKWYEDVLMVIVSIAAGIVLTKL
jgi:hypothetical protein